MADGLLQTFPGTFTTGRKLLISNNPLAMQTGALLYIDPMDPVDPWAAGVPANGSKIKNLACWRLAELLNNPGLARYDDYQLPFTLQRQNASELLLERTAKGGLHGLPSQVSTLSDRGVIVGSFDPLSAYIVANPTHNYFLGYVGNKTRDRLSGNFPRYATLRRSNSPNDTRLVAQHNGMTASIIGAASGGPTTYVDINGAPKVQNELGVFVTSAASPAWISTPPATLAEMRFHPMIFGNSSDNGGQANGVQGWVCYTVYMEDLTVSGRSYATVQAQLLAQAQADFAVGGRYAGDTFTNPATFA